MKFLLLLIPTILLVASQARSQSRDSLEYIIQMKSGDHFRGKLVSYTDSTMIIRTEFGRVEVPKRLIASFIEADGPYRRRPQHFLMPTASPNGPGGSITDYELGFLYGNYGLGYGATISGGITLVPTVAFRKQIFYVGAKFTVDREPEMELALGATYTWLTLDQPYSHIYAVGTFPLGTGRYSVMLMYRVAGQEVAPIEFQAFNADTTRFTLFYEGSLGAAIGFDVPAFGREDISFVGEIWNVDITKPRNTASMLGVRLFNDKLSADFGVAIFSSPLVVPATSFTWKF